MIEKCKHHYGFTHPFGRDLAPGMLHRHAAHNEAVARIGWCIAERPIGVVTGEVGAGKTVAVRTALSSLDSSPPHGHLPAQPDHRGPRHPRPDRHRPRRATPVHHATLVPQTADALAAERDERGRTPVLVLDEAHLLDHAQLESIRMLTNHDMDPPARSPACSSASPPCGGG